MLRSMKIFFRNSVILTVAALLAAATTGWAMEDIELDRIVVTSSRTEEAASETGRWVDTVSEEELEFFNPQGLADALRDQTPVLIGDYGALGAQKTVSMRGSTASQVLVLIDGRPVNSARSGDIDLNTVPLDNIEKIEVLRGPASTLYGSSAMGGVINILTKDAPEEGQETEITNRFGTFRTYQEQLSHGARIKKFGYRINTGYQSSEGHRDNAAYHSQDYSGKMSYDFSENNTLTVGGGYYRDLVGTPGEITSPDINDKQKTAKSFFDVKWDAAPWPQKKIDISARIYQNDDRLEFIETPDPLDRETHRSSSRGLGVIYNQELTSFWKWVGGFDWIDHYNDSTVTAKHHYSVGAGYLVNKFKPCEKLQLNVGTRVDDYSNFGTEISPSFDAVLSAQKDLKLRFLIARSFRAPTFNDLYWPSAFGAEGNPNLLPEKGTSGEFGIEKVFSRWLRLGLTYFRSHYNNLIKWQEDTDGIWRPKNVDTAVIYGIEEDLTLAFTDTIELSMRYKFLAAKDDKTNKFLTYQPKNTIQCLLTFERLAGCNIGVQGLFVDRAYHDAANTIFLKRYYTLGLTVSKDFNENAGVFCNIDNVLNKKYETRRRFPLPGLSVRSGIKLKF